MVNGLHLYSAFIQSALPFLPLIHPFTHQRRLAAMQGTNQLVRSNLGLGVLLRDTSTRPGWDRTGNPPTARRQLYLLSHIAPLELKYIYIYNIMILLRHLADAFIQSDLQLITLSRIHAPLEQCGVKGLAQGPTAMQIL